MKHAIIFALALFLFPRTAVAPTCYVRLADASGYTPTAGQLDTLEQAAAALCTVFDSAGFGGQFKVYDFGFTCTTRPQRAATRSRLPGK